MDRDLDWIVMKCLEKDRTRRYETANGLILDIRRYLANEIVVARPPGTAYRMQKFVQRHRSGVAAGVIVLTALLLAAVVSTVQARRAEKHAFAASEARAAAVDAERRAIKSEHTARKRLYNSHMLLAQRALEESNFGRASDYLAQHTTNSNEAIQWESATSGGSAKVMSLPRSVGADAAFERSPSRPTVGPLPPAVMTG